MTGQLLSKEVALNGQTAGQMRAFDDISNEMAVLSRDLAEPITKIQSQGLCQQGYLLLLC